MKKDNIVLSSMDRQKSQFILNKINSQKQSYEEINSPNIDIGLNKNKPIKKDHQYSTPNSLGRIKSKNVFFQKGAGSQSRWRKGKDRFSNSKETETLFPKLFDHRSSEFISSNKSLTFSEIEKQYNNLIEKALEVSISNKDFSKMSSLRTNNVGYINGKFGSERTNTLFQNDFQASDIQHMRIRQSQNKFKARARINRVLG